MKQIELSNRVTVTLNEGGERTVLSVFHRSAHSKSSRTASHNRMATIYLPGLADDAIVLTLKKRKRQAEEQLDMVNDELGKYLDDRDNPPEVCPECGHEM